MRRGHSGKNKRNKKKKKKGNKKFLFDFEKKKKEEKNIGYGFLPIENWVVCFFIQKHTRTHTQICIYWYCVRACARSRVRVSECVCIYHYVNCNPGGKMKTNISYVLIPPPPQIHITLPFLFSWMSLKDLCLLRQKKWTIKVFFFICNLFPSVPFIELQFHSTNWIPTRAKPYYFIHS